MPFYLVFNQNQPDSYTATPNWLFVVDAHDTEKRCYLRPFAFSVLYLYMLVICNLQESAALKKCSKKSELKEKNNILIEEI